MGNTCASSAQKAPEQTPAAADAAGADGRRSRPPALDNLLWSHGHGGGVGRNSAVADALQLRSSDAGVQREIALLRRLDLEASAIAARLLSACEPPSPHSPFIRDSGLSLSGSPYLSGLAGGGVSPMSPIALPGRLLPMASPASRGGGVGAAAASPMTLHRRRGSNGDAYFAWIGSADPYASQASRFSMRGPGSPARAATPKGNSPRPLGTRGLTSHAVEAHTAAAAAAAAAAAETSVWAAAAATHAAGRGSAGGGSGGTTAAGASADGSREMLPLPPPPLPGTIVSQVVSQVDLQRAGSGGEGGHRRASLASVVEEDIEEELLADDAPPAMEHQQQQKEEEEEEDEDEAEVEQEEQQQEGKANVAPSAGNADRAATVALEVLGKAAQSPHRRRKKTVEPPPPLPGAIVSQPPQQQQQQQQQQQEEEEAAAAVVEAASELPNEEQAEDESRGGGVVGGGVGGDHDDDAHQLTLVLNFANAQEYRRDEWVYAFRTAVPVTFVKSWGISEGVADDWVIYRPARHTAGVAGTAAAEAKDCVGPTGRAPTSIAELHATVGASALGGATQGEIFICAAATFEQTYQQVDGKRHRYLLKGTVLARRIGLPFRALQPKGPGQSFEALPPLPLPLPKPKARKRGHSRSRSGRSSIGVDVEGEVRQQQVGGPGDFLLQLVEEETHAGGEEGAEGAVGQRAAGHDDGAPKNTAAVAAAVAAATVVQWVCSAQEFRSAYTPLGQSALLASLSLQKGAVVFNNEEGRDGDGSSDSMDEADSMDDGDGDGGGGGGGGGGGSSSSSSSSGRMKKQKQKQKQKQQQQQQQTKKKKKKGGGDDEPNFVNDELSEDEEYEHEQYEEAAATTTRSAARDLAASAAGGVGGALVDNTRKLQRLLAGGSLDRWDFPVFELRQLSRSQPLLHTGIALFRRHNLLRRPRAVLSRSGSWGAGAMGQAAAAASEQAAAQDEAAACLAADPGAAADVTVDARVLAEYFSALERAYLPNPYHNSSHAADVAQTINAICCATGMAVPGEPQALPKVQLLALILAGAMHDVAHPGTNNAFQVRRREREKERASEPAREREGAIRPPARTAAATADASPHLTRSTLTLPPPLRCFRRRCCFPGERRRRHRAPLQRHLRARELPLRDGVPPDGELAAGGRAGLPGRPARRGPHRAAEHHPPGAGDGPHFAPGAPGAVQADRGQGGRVLERQRARAHRQERLGPTHAHGHDHQVRGHLAPRQGPPRAPALDRALPAGVLGAAGARGGDDAARLDEGGADHGGRRQEPDRLHQVPRQGKLQQRRRLAARTACNCAAPRPATADAPPSTLTRPRPVPPPPRTLPADSPCSTLSASSGRGSSRCSALRASSRRARPWAQKTPPRTARLPTAPPPRMRTSPPPPQQQRRLPPQTTAAKSRRAAAPNQWTARPGLRR